MAAKVGLALFIAASIAFPGVQDCPTDDNPYREAFEALGGRRVAEDRCTRCHLGIDNPDFRIKGKNTFADQELQKKFADAYPQKKDQVKFAKAFREHPRPDLFVKHNTDCLSCHGSEKRELRTKYERDLWAERYVKEHEGFTLLRTKYTESSCRSCHGAEAEILDGAEKYAKGFQIAQATACYACHQMDDFEGARKPGPPLTHLSDKMSREFAFHFVKDPESFRPTTRMPRFFRREDDDPELGPKFPPREGKVLAASIVEYLFSKSRGRNLTSPVKWATDEDEQDDRIFRGQDIVNQVGCTACHRLDESYNDDFVLGQYDKHSKEFGPNLVGVGDKFDNPKGRAWLFHWIKNPKHFFADTRMPDLRLSDEETRDVVEFLASLKINNDVRTKVTQRRMSAGVQVVPDWAPGEYSIDEHILDELVQEFGGTKDTKNKAVFLGKKAVEHFGCYSCHEIADPDLEGRGPVGDPWSMELIPGRGKFVKMPFSSISPTESDALLTYLLSLARPGKPGLSAKLAGHRVITSYNCKGCHPMNTAKMLVEDQGIRWARGRVKDEDEENFYMHWLGDSTGRPAVLSKSKVLERRARDGGDIIESLKSYKDRALELKFDHGGHLKARMAPNLAFEGERVRPEWLRSFLRKPVEIRPLLRTQTVKNRDDEEVEEFNLRMPTFPLQDREIDSLVAYFGGKEDEESSKPILKRVMDNSCMKCHGTWAPDLQQAGERLRPKWLEAYLRDPLRYESHSLMPAVDALRDRK